MRDTSGKVMENYLEEETNRTKILYDGELNNLYSTADDV
jgi:hypothetical protein